MNKVDDAIRGSRPFRVVMLVANEFVHDTRVYKEARSLIEWGCEVHVLAMAKGDLPAREINDGIRVHRIALDAGDIRRVGASVLAWWSRRLLRRLHRPLESGEPGVTRPAARRTRLSKLNARFTAWIKRVSPTAFRLLALNHRMARVAMTLEPDVIHAHDLNTLFAGRVVKRLARIPLVYDSHELYLERNIGNRSVARDRLVWAPVQSLCIRRCDATMSVAASICTHLERQYGIPKPHLIRNVQPWEPPAPRTRLLSDELGIPRDQAVVLYPGAVTINRGLETMIDTAPLLDGAVFVIMGYARNPKYLQSLVDRAEALGVLGSRLHFREAVPIEDVVRYTASADLGIVPTRNVCLSYFYESSNKIFHCIMAGVPLVMSDHAEKRAIVDRYGVGALFDETDPRAIARTVAETLADRGAYRRMAANCVAAARTLNWEHEEHALRGIYAGLLGAGAPPVPPVELPESVTTPEITITVGDRSGVPSP